MKRYVSTCISGLQTVVNDVFSRTLSAYRPLRVYDGLLIYETSTDPVQLAKPGVVNNTYLLNGIFKDDLSGDINDSIRKNLSSLRIDTEFLRRSGVLKKQRSFKLFANDRNRPVRLDYTLTAPLEKQIQSSLGLLLELRRPDAEFVFSRRSEGMLLFMTKLTYSRVTEKDLPQGALRPELCRLMAEIAEIGPSDIVLDPFCGHGSIPVQVMKHYRYNMIFANDNDAQLVAAFKKEYGKNDRRLFIKCRDVLDPANFQDDFIDKIVTDPPWNIYQHSESDFADFYARMLREFLRILKPGGTCTILMGNLPDFESAMRQVPQLVLQARYPILVNGKKATVFRLGKEITT